MKKLRVTVEGKVYEVLVEMLDDSGAALAAAPAAAPVAAPASLASMAAPAAPAAAPKSAAPAAAGAGDIPSPLAGKVVSIDVKVGQTVAEGAQVATVEAMKMNTYIYAPRAGSVAAILVNPGDGVEEGASLLRLA
jgi:biotin carboxyl carrier protein